MPLERSIGLGNLIFYGTGTILGAGIFVVVGEVVGEAGALTPLAYAVAGVVALFTALSFAEIAARVPSAGGPIDYTDEAFGNRTLSAITGWLLITANIVSGATIVTGFVGYLNSFLDVPGWMATCALVAVICGVSVAGIRHSAWFMTLTTLVGLATLLLIVWLMRDSLLGWPERVLSAGGEFNADAMTGVFAGAFLAIYSFIGFGDIAQTAEEVKDVKRTMPRAMIAALVIMFVFYIAVSAALAGRDDLQEIAGADAPLVYAATSQSGFPALPLAIASLFVIVNGGLAQLIAAARLLMDMARDGRSGVPARLAVVHEKTRTPVLTTLILAGVLLFLALFVPLKSLASATSLAILAVFVAVNASLWKLKRRDQPRDVPDIWLIVPVIGVATCVLTLIGQIALWFMR